MQIAILTLTGISATASIGCLLVMLKTAHEVKTAGESLKSDVDTFKKKTDRNVTVIKTALGQLEM